MSSLYVALAAAQLGVPGGVAIGKPWFDRRLGVPVVPAVTAVPVLRRRSEEGVSETYEEFLARVERFECYELTAVELDKARAKAWEDRAATEIACRHDATIAYLIDSGLVPRVTVRGSYTELGDRVRVAAGPVSLGCVAERKLLNITVDIDAPEPLRDAKRELTTDEFQACDPKPIAFTARLADVARK